MEVNKKDMRLLDLTSTWSVVILMIRVFISLLVERSVHGLSSNQNLSLKYDFHGYMVRSMEEEFQRILVLGSNLYFWIAIIPVAVCGTVSVQLQHIAIIRPSHSDGTNYKAAVIPQRIRETIHGWKEAAKRRKRYGSVNDDSMIHTQTTVFLLEEDEHELYDGPVTGKYTDIELQPTSTITPSPSSPIAADENSSRAATPLCWPSSSLSSFGLRQNDIRRSHSMLRG